MPIKDPAARAANSKRWRIEKMQEGYGKALYARRAHRYRNEEILRAAVYDALDRLNDGKPALAAKRLLVALQDAPPIGKPIEYMP